MGRDHFANLEFIIPLINLLFLLDHSPDLPSGQGCCAAAAA
jgi:hypothetical protein